MAEDRAGVRALPELRERRYKGERYYRYRDELEEPREHQRYEVHRLDKRAVLDKAEGRSEDKARAVEYRGARSCFLFKIIIRQFCHDIAPCNEFVSIIALSIQNSYMFSMIIGK